MVELWWRKNAAKPLFVEGQNRDIVYNACVPLFGIYGSIWILL